MILQGFGMLGLPHSWSYVNTSILMEFQKRNIDLICKSTNGANNIPAPLKPFVVDMKLPIKTETSFGYTIPPNLLKIDAKNKIDIFNSDNTILPPGWAQLLNKECSLVLPSSRFAAEVLLKNGVKKDRIKIVPHGYYPEFFNPEIKPLTITDHDPNKFVFLVVAAPHWRKGIEITMRAFIEEFKNDEDVTLLIKSSMNSHEAPSHFHINLNKVKSELEKSHPYQWPEIKLINYRVESLGSLYRYADAVVLNSRAECFSLTMLEAGACKIPVITTNYGGHLDFLNKQNSTLTDYKIVKCPKEGQYHFFHPNSLIAEPEIEHVKEMMRHVKNNYDEATKKAELLYAQIKDRYTWTNVADQILKLVNDKGWKL